MAKKLSESAMYPAVKSYFTEERGCGTTFADLPEDEILIRVSRNLGMREIDVVGIKKLPGGYDVHIAEGKRFAKPHSFAEAVNQLEDAADYAHYRWVFFPADQWDQISAADRKLNAEKLKNKGFGLLLVDGDKCREEVQAIRETAPDPKRIEAVLRAADIKIQNHLPACESLRPDEAVRASLALAACLVGMSILPDAAEAAGLKLPKPSWQTLEVGEEDFAEWARDFSGWSGTSGGEVDFDPFGTSAGDGQPTLWVLPSGDNEAMRSYLKRKDRPFGTHVFFDDGAWHWKTVMLADVDDEIVEHMIALGFGAEIEVGHRIALGGRSVDGLAREITDVLKSAKKSGLWKK